jgi:hypothetical protein
VNTTDARPALLVVEFEAESLPLLATHVIVAPASPWSSSFRARVTVEVWLVHMYAAETEMLEENEDGMIVRVAEADVRLGDVASNVVEPNVEALMGTTA